VDSLSGLIDLDLKGMIYVIIAGWHLRNPQKDAGVGVFLRTFEFQVQNKILKTSCGCTRANPFRPAISGLQF